MNRKAYLKAATELLVRGGWDAEEAKVAVKAAVAGGEPLLETLCFHQLVQGLLAPIHTSTWIKNRARQSDGEETAVIKRLLDAGASPKDLAIFARLMQREYLVNLGCVLDGSGIYDTPDVPFSDFRVFAVDDTGKACAEITDLHESLGFSDLKTEMKLSRGTATGS